MVGLFEACSLYALLLVSPLKNPPPFDPGGTVEVGDARTSAPRRDGGWLRLSEFQIPLLQGKFELLAALPVPHAAESIDGVLGWEVVGDIVLEANEPLRGCGTWLLFSNHEARRDGFC